MYKRVYNERQFVVDRRVQSASVQDTMRTFRDGFGVRRDYDRSRTCLAPSMYTGMRSRACGEATFHSGVTIAIYTRIHACVRKCTPITTFRKVFRRHITRHTNVPVGQSRQQCARQHEHMCVFMSGSTAQHLYALRCVFTRSQ